MEVLMKRKMKLGAVILALSLALSSLLAVAIPSAAVTEETPAPADSTERLEPTGALEGNNPLILLSSDYVI